MKVWGGRRTKVAAPAAGVLGLVGVLFACNAQATESITGEALGRERPVPPKVHVIPGNTAHNIRPTDTVTVRADHGKIMSVDVTSDKKRSAPVDGRVSEGQRRWESTEKLDYSTRYAVSVEVKGENGRTTRSTSSFTTLTPRRTVAAHVAPLEGETVGVGMPIIIYFTNPVRNHAAVERVLEVETSKPVTGSWYWMDDEELHYRPRQYWPANTDVRLRIPIRGVHAGGGVWGARNRVIDFRIGDAIVSRVDVDRHHMVVTRNGKRLRTVPVSTGKAGFLTRGGTKVVLAKERVKIMDARTIGISPDDPEYYNLRVEYAVRVTWSGEFIHSAPWSVGSQGSANVSHGCVGMSPANAAWYFDMAKRGDVVEVVGSPRRMELRNGYGDWNLSWARWQKGSALS